MTNATATATTAADRAAEKAITALKAFARTPKQTYAVCATVHAATVAGVSVRKLADNWETKAAGFSSARVGHFAKAYSRALSAGLTLTGTDAECNLIARMLTAVSGGSVGIKSAVLDAMCASAATRGIDAQTLANELAAESDAHELTKADAAQGDATDTAPTDTADTAPADIAPAAATALAFLARLTATVGPDAFDSATLAAIATAAAALSERATLAAAVATAELATV